MLLLVKACSCEKSISMDIVFFVLSYRNFCSLCGRRFRSTYATYTKKYTPERVCFFSKTYTFAYVCANFYDQSVFFFFCVCYCVCSTCHTKIIKHTRWGRHTRMSSTSMLLFLLCARSITINLVWGYL
jgi:hypothetical protein